MLDGDWCERRALLGRGGEDETKYEEQGVSRAFKEQFDNAVHHHYACTRHWKVALVALL